MASETNEIMTLVELAKYLKVSRSTIYKLSRAGELPGSKVGKSWRFHKEAIDRWLSEKKPGKIET